MAFTIRWQPARRRQWRPVLWSDLGFGLKGAHEPFEVPELIQAEMAADQLRARLQPPVTARIEILDTEGLNPPPRDLHRTDLRYDPSDGASWQARCRCGWSAWHFDRDTADTAIQQHLAGPDA